MHILAIETTGPYCSAAVINGDAEVVEITSEQTLSHLQSLTVMHIEDLAKSFGYGSNKRELFRGVNIDIRRGEKICIVGANGIGKTTFM
jgi:ATPase components of ABC transporters with duplicated ATPase domains